MEGDGPTPKRHCNGFQGSPQPLAGVGGDVGGGSGGRSGTFNMGIATNPRVSASLKEEVERKRIFLVNWCW